MRRQRHLPAGTRLVSVVPDLDWDRWLGELKTKREAREQELAESERHYQSEMASEQYLKVCLFCGIN